MMPLLRPEAPAPTPTGSSTATDTPSRARKYAVAQPRIPAPTITTSFPIAGRDYARRVPQTSLAVETFRFTGRSIDPAGIVRLGYALDDITFEETFHLPAPTTDSPATEQLLDLLHWVAGVSYYKAAIPEKIAFDTGRT